MVDECKQEKGKFILIVFALTLNYLKMKSESSYFFM
jgi:hypothetical protein